MWVRGDPRRSEDRAEWERQRWRQREREMRETKGMWSSQSLCLAALWLKRGVPGERGGSRPAQSVLSLPWSPACRPQKHTTKPSGRAPFFIAMGSPSALQNLQSKHRSSYGSSSTQFRGRTSALDELLPRSQRSSFFDVLMKISHAFLKASRYTWTCQPPRLGKKRIFGKWFSRKFLHKKGKKVNISLLNLP